MQLVTREGKKINAGALHINLQFARRLHSVGVKENSLAPANSGDFLDGEKHSRFVIGPHH